MHGRRPSECVVVSLREPESLPPAGAPKLCPVVPPLMLAAVSTWGLRRLLAVDPISYPTAAKVLVAVNVLKLHVVAMPPGLPLRCRLALGP